MQIHNVLDWYVYILIDEQTQRTYVGITTNTQRRLLQHNGIIKGGAKSTKISNTWKYHKIIGPFTTRSEALKLEYKIKQLSKEEKLQYE